MLTGRTNRREFIAVLGSAAAWPVMARAQQPTMPVVGFLSIASPTSFAHLVAGLRRGLQEAGFVEGHNVAIEYRWAEGRYDRLPELAADLVQRQVAVIVTSGGDYASLAAKAATTTIPIVFITGNALATSPVLTGSLARPGGNATGVNVFTSELAEKRFGLLNDAIPAAASFAVLANPNATPAMSDLREVEAAGRRVGKDVAIFYAGSEGEINSAFARIAQSRPGALLVVGDPFFNVRREQIVTLAARHAIPAIYEWREFAEAGGLMSYGANLSRPIACRASTLVASSRARSRPIFRCCNRPNSSWSSTSRPPRRSASSLPPSLLSLADEVIE